jgi:hypothetical protein
MFDRRKHLRLQVRQQLGVHLLQRPIAAVGKLFQRLAAAPRADPLEQGHLVAVERFVGNDAADHAHRLELKQGRKHWNLEENESTIYGTIGKKQKICRVYANAITLNI